MTPGLRLLSKTRAITVSFAGSRPRLGAPDRLVYRFYGYHDLSDWFCAPRPPDQVGDRDS